jgi:hypothetical protein
MTIAKKLSTKISKIRQKYGKPLTINITQTQTGNKITPKTTTQTITLLDYMTAKTLATEMTNRLTTQNKANSITFDNLFSPMNKINWRTLRNLSSVCCICGSSENVEMHHIHQIRKGKVEGFAQVMKQLNRKTVPLCKEHHIAVEKGLIQDIRVKDLYNIEEFLA